MYIYNINIIVWIYILIQHICNRNMPKWKKDETEFVVSVIHLEHRNIVNIPKPIIKHFKDPSNLKFVIRDKSVTVEPVKEPFKKKKAS